MRTTIHLDDDLLRQAKRAAAESGQTLTALVEESLRQRLSRRSPKAPRKPIRLVTDGSGGVGPGVDLDDTSALIDLMDGVHGPVRR